MIDTQGIEYKDDPIYYAEINGKEEEVEPLDYNDRSKIPLMIDI